MKFIFVIFSIYYLVNLSTSQSLNEQNSTADFVGLNTTAFIPIVVELNATTLGPIVVDYTLIGTNPVETTSSTKIVQQQNNKPTSIKNSCNSLYNSISLTYCFLMTFQILINFF